MSDCVAVSDHGEWLGHPKGLYTLVGTEVWERFSFLGMQALLMLYMTKYLLIDGRAEKVLGLNAFRAGVESVFGPLTDLAFAAQTYGLYSAALYLTPVAGAWLGDRVLGQSRSVFIGCIVMALGHGAMAIESMFLVALTMLILGAGLLIGNLTAKIGSLYSLTDERRTRAFGIYLIAINIGALIAPLVIGTLGEEVDWHLGFGAAGVGMVIGSLVFLFGRRYLPPDDVALRRARALPVPRLPLTGSEWRRIGVLMLLLFAPYMLYGAASFVSYSTMYIWADTHVDRMMFGFEVPVTWIGIFDGVATIAGVWLGNRFSIWLAKRRGRDWGDMAKFGIGMTGVALAWVFIALTGAAVMTPVVFWLLFYIIQDWSYAAFIEPQVNAVVSRDSPQSVVAIMMSMIKMSSAVSYIAAGWLGRFYEPLGAQKFFLLIAAVAGVSAVMMIVPFRWWVRRLGPAEAIMES